MCNSHHQRIPGLCTSNAINVKPSTLCTGGTGSWCKTKTIWKVEVFGEVHSPVVSPTSLLRFHQTFSRVSPFLKFVVHLASTVGSIHLQAMESIPDPIHEWVSEEIITFIATMMKCGLAMGHHTHSGNVMRWIGEIQFARPHESAAQQWHTPSLQIATIQLPTVS